MIKGIGAFLIFTSNPTLKLPPTSTGQPYGRGGCACAIGGVCQHASLCCVSGWQPGCPTATHGVCSDGESVRGCACSRRRQTSCPMNVSLPEISEIAFLEKMTFFAFRPRKSRRPWMRRNLRRQ